MKEALLIILVHGMIHIFQPKTQMMMILTEEVQVVEVLKENLNLTPFLKIR